MISLSTFLTWDLWVHASTLQAILFSGFSPWYFVIPIAGIAAIFIFRNYYSNAEVQETYSSSEPKPDGKDVVEFNRYAGGHPEITELVTPCIVNVDSGVIEICRYSDNQNSQIECIGRISLDSVQEIRVEDVFTMKKNMTPENWKIAYKHLQSLNHKKGTEVAFLVIEWNQDTDHYYTYLCIEDDYAMEMAVKKRNAVVKMARQKSPQLATA